MGESCPYCKKPISDEDALLCLYCGESLGRRAGFLGGMRYFRPRVVVWAIIVSVLLVFVAWAMRTR